MHSGYRKILILAMHLFTQQKTKTCRFVYAQCTTHMKQSIGLFGETFNISPHIVYIFALCIKPDFTIWGVHASGEPPCIIAICG